MMDKLDGIYEEVLLIKDGLNEVKQEVRDTKAAIHRLSNKGWISGGASGLLIAWLYVKAKISGFF